MNPSKLVKKLMAGLESGEPTGTEVPASETSVRSEATLPAWRFLPIGKTTIELGGKTFRLRKVTRRDLVFRPISETKRAKKK